MPYKQTATRCVMRIVALRGLSPALQAQCQALRQEAGRLWTDLVWLHPRARAQGREALSWRVRAGHHGRYALHSQRAQALCQKFAANVQTATDLRKQELAESGRIQTAYPHHAKAYQTVVWKDQALTVLPGRAPASAHWWPASCPARATAS